MAKQGLICLGPCDSRDKHSTGVAGFGLRWEGGRGLCLALGNRVVFSLVLLVQRLFFTLG